ncbi:Tetratricopeptide repeat-containing protein [Eubacterium ruminantium]|nr:Tetratricopeptide repeat-containing protein [Eubacterium ruminantium]
MDENRKDVKESQKKQKFHIENPRAFMLVTDIICALVLALALYFGIRYIMNETFINHYEDEQYETSIMDKLSHLNYYESYLPYYNKGNAEYKNGNYDKAIAAYKKALDENPPHRGEKECDIRVNLALAMIAKIDFSEMTDEKDVQRIIRQLKAARNVLTEEGCANPDNPDGHNKEAEQLKKDIDDFLDQLQQQQDQDDQQDDQQDQDQNNDEQNNQFSDRENDLKEQLENQMTDSLQEHSDAEKEKEEKENGIDWDNYGLGKTW